MMMKDQQFEDDFQEIKVVEAQQVVFDQQQEQQPVKAADRGTMNSEQTITSLGDISEGGVQIMPDQNVLAAVNGQQ